jgi:N-acylneuraminate cytidylyltransferase/CMP-N,N'-diacetyllegionaminic acid synthase
VTYTLATICARGGSRGVPGKNIRPLAGHPLIAYSIAQAKRCDFVDRLIVSTDSEEIAAVARAYGAEVPFLRPPELARDTSAKVPVIQHAVGEIERHLGHSVDVVVDLDPTSPLRTVDDIAACWRLVQEPGTDVVFTVSPAEKNPYFNMVELDEAGYARLSKAAPTPVHRRQDAPAVYSMNASVYAYQRAHLMDDGRVVSGRARIVTMPPERSRDIDGPLDLAFLEFLVREGHVTLPEVSQ